MKNKERKITLKMQQVAVDILIRFICADAIVSPDIYNEIMTDYNLMSDPFTSLPCTPSEYVDSHREYERQIMMEKYGHCDGLD